MLPPQSVLLSSRAPIGLVAINTIPVCTNQGFKNLVPRNGSINADYLYWWLKCNNAFLQSLGRGATFKEVSKAIVSRIEIPLPPLAEQKRICGDTGCGGCRPACSSRTPASPPPSCSSPRPTPAATDDVWFYDMHADGFSFDDKRTPQPDESDLPDLLKRWRNRAKEKGRKRTDQSFLVPKSEVAGNDYDLSINRYKEVAHEAVEYDSPKVIPSRPLLAYLVRESVAMCSVWASSL
jgi:hypothetical protein